jgi:hypothetical protein
VLGEDVKDHDGAIEHLRAQRVLERALLRGRQLVVEDDRVDAALADPVAQLGDLAAPDERGGVRSVTALHEPLDHLAARGVDEQLQLVERRRDLDVGFVVQPRGDQDRPLDGADDVDALPGRMVADPFGLCTTLLRA